MTDLFFRAIVPDELDDFFAALSVAFSDPRPDPDKIKELFLQAFARQPTAEQLTAALAELAEYGQNKKFAYENIIWAIINSKEFILIQ